MGTKEDRGWSPYLAGALTGIVLILSVVIAGKYFGVSTTYARSAGMVEQVFDAERVAQNAYFMKYVPRIDWQWMFVLGIIIGALVSSATSGTFRLQAVPDMWRERFGPGRAKRAAVAFAGGAIALFGARLAGG